MNPDYITEAMQTTHNLDWFACDEDGAVAWFESGSYAPIPESVRISDRDRRESIELLNQLEPHTIPIRYPSLFTKDLASSADLPDLFLLFSLRGLYTYEVVDDPARVAPYERATGPATAIHLDQLPPQLRLIIARTQLPCRFSERQQLPLEIAHKAEPFVSRQPQRGAGNQATTSERPARVSYEESCKLLLRLGCLSLLDTGGAFPTLPDRRPEAGDDLPFGVRFFRTWVGNGKPFGLQASDPDFKWDREEHHLQNLTLPRTFFGRSEISRISFKNTDLSESTLCWNDFIEVDFTDVDLSQSDLRASLFTRTIFVGANLRNADLRRSTFKECGFARADLQGSKLTREQGQALPLSVAQKQVIDWQESTGDEPAGG